MTSHCRTNSCLTYLQDITKISLWMSRNIEIGTEQLTLSCGRNWHCGNWLLSVWANSAELTPQCPATSSPRTSARWSSPATPEASTSNNMFRCFSLFNVYLFSVSRSSWMMLKFQVLHSDRSCLILAGAASMVGREGQVVVVVVTIPVTTTPLSEEGRRGTIAPLRAPEF